MGKKDKRNQSFEDAGFELGGKVPFSNELSNLEAMAHGLGHPALEIKSALSDYAKGLQTPTPYQVLVGPDIFDLARCGGPAGLPTFEINGPAYYAHFSDDVASVLNPLKNFTDAASDLQAYAAKIVQPLGGTTLADLASGAAFQNPLNDYVKGMEPIRQQITQANQNLAEYAKQVTAPFGDQQRSTFAKFADGVRPEIPVKESPFSNKVGPASGLGKRDSGFTQSSSNDQITIGGPSRDVRQVQRRSSPDVSSDDNPPTVPDNVFNKRVPTKEEQFQAALFELMKLFKSERERSQRQHEAELEESRLLRKELSETRRVMVDLVRNYGHDLESVKSMIEPMYRDLHLLTKHLTDFDPIELPDDDDVDG